MPPRSRRSGAPEGVEDAEIPSEFEDAERDTGTDPDGETTDPDNPEPANPGADPVGSPDSEDADDEDDLDDESGYDPSSLRAADDVYVVTTDLVTLKTGSRTNDAIRARRGQLVKIPAGHKYIDVDNLIRLKAIAPNDGEPKRRTTAAALAQAAGAADDPVKLPASMLVKDTTIVPANDPIAALD